MANFMLGVFLLGGLLNATALAGQSATADTLKTIGMFNGRYWGTLNEGSYRSVYLTGVLDGWFLSTTGEDGVRGKYLNIFSRGSGGSFSTDDLAEMVTSVYANTENLNLPIPWVAMACLAIVRGETTRDLVFPALRKHLSSDAGIGPRIVPQIPVDVIEKSRPK